MAKASAPGSRHSSRSRSATACRRGLSTQRSMAFLMTPRSSGTTAAPPCLGITSLGSPQLTSRREWSHEARRNSERYAEPLAKIEQRFGVPGPVLVAIWGQETSFGGDNGSYPTFTALATLAYDCRRADRFRAELIDAIALVDRGVVTQPRQLHGAWAGEIGQTQLMPSAYLMYATTPDGSGTPDLIHNSADALASTAAFLKGHGWQPGAGWNEGEPNFAAILQWNSAEVYAKTVALFADRLAGK